MADTENGKLEYPCLKHCSLDVLNMILETPNFKVTNIIFESYEHRSKIILQLLTSFVFLKVGFVPHRRIYSKNIPEVVERVIEVGEII
jgi:hypothetical protein